MHGMDIELPDGVNHLHIAGVDDTVPADLFVQTDEPVEISFRKGTYSPVSGLKDILEWDGWGTND